jgi:hypothetical protein
MNDSTHAIATPKIVAVCAAALPIKLPKNLVPNKPAIVAPTNGANGIARSRRGFRVGVVISISA